MLIENLMSNHHLNLPNVSSTCLVLNRLTTKSTKMELQDQIIQEYLVTGCGLSKTGSQKPHQLPLLLEEGCGEMLQACKPVSVTRRGVNAIIYLR